MSANTRTANSSPRQGRTNDLANVAAAICRRQGLVPEDMFGGLNKLQLVYTELARYEVDFLSRLADLRPLADLKPYLYGFNDTPDRFWEIARRHAAVVILLHLREQVEEDPEDEDLDAASIAEIELGHRQEMY